MPDVADDAALGSPATQVAVVAVMAVTLVGAVAARRGVPGQGRLVVATALLLSAGVTATLGIAFAFAGILVVFTVLMIHTTVSIALLGRAVLRFSTGTPR